ncbi:unnamed protein product [Didymodactylos carnosus]|uniref:CDT1 Geminin-binding domain-containing protein n=1 Tax=Didymodactylos carnosus TaxID=1234261 RepID=A0A813RA40_9BILA|nr:unnamed protein product [Didymodactylos carnosus]CAF3560852.1 unnamed protein product [Didymodactylos carnosus]
MIQSALTDYYTKRRLSNTFDRPIKKAKIELDIIDEKPLSSSLLIDPLLKNQPYQAEVSKPLSTLDGQSTLTNWCKKQNITQEESKFIEMPTKEQETLLEKKLPQSPLKFIRPLSLSKSILNGNYVQLREKLLEDENLDEIRERVKTFNKDLQKYRQKYGSFNRSPLSSPIKKSPMKHSPIKHSPFKTVTLQSPIRNQTPLKKNISSIPAYQRFQNLANKSCSADLILPYKYKLLFEQYKHVDFLVCHTHNQQGICTFLKVKELIQQKTKKNFELSTLGKMKTVCPNMYEFRQEKIQLPTLSPVKLKYELTIYPCLIDLDINNDRLKSIQIDASMIVERLTRFRLKLIDIVKSFHRKFLATLCPAVNIPEENLIRWHPEFDLENIPDIDVADLPVAPDAVEKKNIATTIDLLAHAQTTKSERVKRALFNIFDNKSSSDINIVSLPPTSVPDSKTLSSISASLVEKIRLKEKEKLCLHMIDNNGNKQTTLDLLHRLQQSIEIIQQYFILERQISVDIDRVCKQLRDCHTSNLSYAQCMESILYLTSHFNEWLSLIKCRGKEYVKINRQKSINTIIENIQKQIKELTT